MEPEKKVEKAKPVKGEIHEINRNTKLNIQAIRKIHGNSYRHSVPLMPSLFCYDLGKFFMW